MSREPSALFRPTYLIFTSTRLAIFSAVISSSVCCSTYHLRTSLLINFPCHKHVQSDSWQCFIDAAREFPQCTRLCRIAYRSVQDVSLFVEKGDEIEEYAPDILRCHGIQQDMYDSLVYQLLINISLVLLASQTWSTLNGRSDSRFL
jgi:hypothetical protein